MKVYTHWSMGVLPCDVHVMQATAHLAGQGRAAQLWLGLLWRLMRGRTCVVGLPNVSKGLRTNRSRRAAPGGSWQCAGRRHAVCARAQHRAPRRSRLQYACACNTRALAIRVRLQYACACNTRAPAIRVRLQYACACNTRALAIRVRLQYACACNTRAPAIRVRLQYACACNTRALAIRVRLQYACACNTRALAIRVRLRVRRRGGPAECRQELADQQPEARARGRHRQHAGCHARGAGRAPGQDRHAAGQPWHRVCRRRRGRRRGSRRAAQLHQGVWCRVY